MDGITDSMDLNLGKFQEMVKGRKAWRTALHGVTESGMSQRLSNNPFLVRLFVLLVLSCVSYWHVLDQSFIRRVACPLLHGLRSQSAAPALAGGASGLLSEATEKIPECLLPAPRST